MSVKILVIRFRRIGDALLSSAVCSTLKESIPDSEIHYVLNEPIAPLFENHPHIDKVITFSDEENRKFFKKCKKVRRLMKAEKYDIIIDLRGTLNTLIFSLFSPRTKYRIGRKVPYNRWIHNRRIDIEQVQGNYIDRMLSLTDPLNPEYNIKKNHAYKLYITDQEKQEFRDYMESSGIDFSKPIMLAAVTSRVEHKKWPLENMAEIFRRTIEYYPDVQIIFNYTPGREEHDAYTIYNMLDKDDHIFINIEAKGLRQLIAMMFNVDFFFGNEGGPRHFSQAANVPSFALYHPEVKISDWLPNRSERFAGIEPKDINPGIASDPNATMEEKFGLFTPDEVWERLQLSLAKFLTKN